MKKLLYILCALLSLIGCTKYEELTDNEGNNSNLSISADIVTVSSKTIIENSFSNGDILGLFILDSSGNTYDDKNYNNTCFAAAEVNNQISWFGQSVALSATNASINAYYPYSESVTDLRSIPVSSGGTDYMYATQVDNISSINNHANLSMNHALACVRINISRGTYTKDGLIQSIAIQGEQIAQSGSLNAITGELAELNELNSQIIQSSLTNTIDDNSAIDFIVVHSDDSETINLSITIDEEVYLLNTEEIQLSQGLITSINLVQNNNKVLELGEVIVTEWSCDTEVDNSFTVVDNISLTGDTEYLAFNISSLEDSAIIKVKSLDADWEIGYALESDNADITSVYDETSGLLTLTVSNMTGGIIINFNVVKNFVKFSIFGGEFYPITISSDNDSWQVDFGDGTTSETGLTMSQISQLSHTYDEWGVYYIRYYNSSNDVKITGIDAQDNDNILGFFNCNYDCSQVTDLSYAFSNCTSLWDISGLNGMTKVTNLSYAFFWCNNLTDISALSNMTQVTDLSCAFLVEPDMSWGEFNISALSGMTKVTNLSGAFEYRITLNDITALSGMTQVTNLSSAFNGCSELVDISALSGMTNVTDLSYAFNGCSSLVDISTLSKMTQVTNLSNAFRNCSSLTDISALSGMTNVTDLNYAFGNCTSLTDISGLSGMTKVTSLFYAFCGCTGLTDISALSNMTQVTDLSCAFGWCSKLNNAVEWWNSEVYPNVLLYSDCYFECTNITSPFLYSEIPSGWK